MNRLIILLIPFLMAAAVQQTPVTMKVGEKKQLAATKAGTSVDWVSTDARVATVINSADPKLNGMVVARHAGTATIVASDHSETQVTVTANPAKTEKKK